MLVGAGIWYTTDVIVADPIVSFGGFVTAAGVGVQPVEDVFHPDVAAYHVPYPTGGAFGVGVFLRNAGHFPVSVTAISFAVYTPDAGVISPVRTVEPFIGSAGPALLLGAFRPFTLDPDQPAVIGWHLTMCPTAAPQQGFSSGYDSFRITYSYGGWSRTAEVLLWAPVYIDDVGTCDASGTTR